MKTRKCAFCGKEFEVIHGNTKFCSQECFEESRKEYQNNRYKAKKEKQTKKKEVRKTRVQSNQINLCTKKCKTCKYRGQINSIIEDSRTGGLCCNYLGITGHSRLRLCPAGDCTVYEKGTPKKMKSGISLQE